MTPGTLRFAQVTKTFAHKPGRRSRRLLRHRILDLLRPGRVPRFTALRDISFDLAPGESLGLVGPNGAGKSTLLNMATGLLMPDAGSIDVYGRVGALLELGAGFHFDLTGVENLRISAALMGLTRGQTDALTEQIIDFSGVRDFIREPLRTYSQGMVLRLAFSVAVAADPDILLIDEIIGVGDQDFFAKALEKIKSFRRAGKTMLIASHSHEALTMLCDRAIWLDHGQIRMQGDAAAVVDAYRGSRVETTSS